MVCKDIATNTWSLWHCGSRDTGKPLPTTHLLGHASYDALRHLGKHHVAQLPAERSTCSTDAVPQQQGHGCQVKHAQEGSGGKPCGIQCKCIHGMLEEEGYLGEQQRQREE